MYQGRDKMEYQPFLGEEAEEENVDLDTYATTGEAFRRERSRRRRLLLLAILSSAAIFGLVVSGLIFAATHDGPSSGQIAGDAGGSGESNWVEPPDLKPTDFLPKYRTAAVAADSGQCSTVGKRLLLSGGNAVDAAIGSLLCLGLADPQSMGIGGGFFMTIYNVTTGKGTVIDARETAPEASTVDMYGGDAELSSKGPLSIAVPGEIKGYWHAHQKYGSLPWSSLFEPSIKMAQDGFPVSIGLHHAIEDDADLLSSEPSLREVFFNKRTGKLFRYNEMMKRPKLAKTLQTIAKEGMGAFGQGGLLQMMMADLQDIGAIITKDDLVNYKVLEKDPLEVTLNGYMRVMSPPPPASGAVLSFMLNILEGYKLQAGDIANVNSRILTYHRTAEAFKFGYAKRTALGDEDFVDIKELVANLTSKAYSDSIRQLITDDATHNYHYYRPSFYTPQKTGTSHLSVLDQEGNAVSVTSTINGRFGAQLRGLRTGIIWNNEMDDFSAPNITNEYGLRPTEANFIAPGKRPLSSMCPAIIVRSLKGEDDGPDSRGGGYVKHVLGASGGSRITSTTAWVAEHNVWLGKNIKESVDLLRLHHQLLPDNLQYEKGFEQPVLEGLHHKGHNLTEKSLGKSISQGIEVRDGWIYAASDFRKGGSPDGF